MSALQWALLILSAVVVVTLVIRSRREKKTLKSWEPPGASQRVLSPMKSSSGEQTDIFSTHGFDEFGVGRARPRTAAAGDDTVETPTPESAVESAATPRVAPTIAPAFLRPPDPAPEAPAAKVADKIVALLIAERDGGVIHGAKLHQALAAQKLSYGAKQIYHRLSGSKTVFSVASLVKPGVLVPAEAQTFSTPGLSVFMVLPGPVKPVTALHDMFETARALARALNAEVYDGKKQPLTDAAMAAIQADVEVWARDARL